MECGRLRTHCAPCWKCWKASNGNRVEPFYTRDISRLHVLKEPGEPSTAQTAAIAQVGSHVTQAARKISSHSFPDQGSFPELFMYSCSDSMNIHVYSLFIFPDFQLVSVKKKITDSCHTQKLMNTQAPLLSLEHHSNFLSWLHFLSVAYTCPKLLSKPISKGVGATSNYDLLHIHVIFLL